MFSDDTLPSLVETLSSSEELRSVNDPEISDAICAELDITPSNIPANLEPVINPEEEIINKLSV